MEDVSPMVIGGSNEKKNEFDVSDQKKKVVKRKRADRNSNPLSPEERQSKIGALQGEINSLIKFGKDLVIKNKEELLKNVEKIGNSYTGLNYVIAYALEGSDLPLSKLVDDIFDKLVGNVGTGDRVTKASVKSNVLLIGQRLRYGVTNADADILEDEAQCALWCWETRDLKLIPKLARMSLKVRRTCCKMIKERISAVLAMITVLENSMDHRNGYQDMIKASDKLSKVFCEADIRSLLENMSNRSSGEMAESEVRREEKLFIKQMEKNKRQMEKEKKKMDRELQKEKLLTEKKLKRLHDEVEKEERRHEKEESEMQKVLKRQQEDDEKNQKKKEKEEAEFKKQLVVQKQASLMERFFKRNRINSPTLDENSTSKTTMLSPDMVERKFESATLAMDLVLSQTDIIEKENIWKSHLNSWKIIGHPNGSNKKVHWGIRQKPKIEMIKSPKLTANKELICDADSSMEKLVDGWVGTNVSGSLPQACSPSSPSKIRVMKLLQFDKSHRPAFYGVWPRKSKVVRACLPYAKDPEIDYEIDSDEEWEEDEPGESLSDCDKEDEDENLESRVKGDDDDESEDGFLVPDGYLSENERVLVDDMDSGEYVGEVRSVPCSEVQVDGEEFCTLFQQHKYLNNLTEHALRKNQPLIIMNLMNEKTSLSSTEELTSIDKLERMCLQTLCMRHFSGLLDIKITTPNDMVYEEREASFDKSDGTVLGITAGLLDLDLPQIISIIQSCAHSIGRIVESLHNKFPAVPKSQLRNKVREISEFSDNRWQIKKEILSNLGLALSPEKNYEKSPSIATFFSKRCLPPSQKTGNAAETSPQTSHKPAPSLANRPQNTSLT